MAGWPLILSLFFIFTFGGEAAESDPPPGKVIEGDMQMTQEQHDMLFGSNDGTSREKRKAWGADEKYRWTDNTIPYSFYPSADYPEDHKRDIRKAMDVFEQETCLRFRPATAADKNKIQFIDGGSCQATLGMEGGEQMVMLNNPQCRFMGLYFHEIGHAIGLVHEHQLPDRDNYIRVQWRNVKETSKRWFVKYKEGQLNRFGVPYDLSSVMHYEINSFPGDAGGQTIKVLDYNKEHYISKVYLKMLSFTDVKIINKMYQCDKRCPRVSCPSEGFVDKSCRCVTPQSYYDSHCKNEGSDEECNEIARSGYCHDNYENVLKCRKSCDECPKFGITFPNKKGSCINRYYDDSLCDKWAREDSCTEWPYAGWMKTHCTKSCGLCGKFNKCTNIYQDYMCDLKTNDVNNFCGKNLQNVWVICADHCDTCGYAPKSIACSNIADDATCQRRSKQGECDEPGTAAWMKTNCASSCHSCGFNQGRCRNIHSDATCERRAGLEGACYSEIVDMHTNCGKTCNTCDFQYEDVKNDNLSGLEFTWHRMRGNCKNFKSNDYCNGMKKAGFCSENPGVFKLYCAKACNSCGYDKARCEDQKAKTICERWKGWGHCETNPEFVKYNCPATCGACGIVTLDDFCEDVQSEEFCRQILAAGSCKSDNRMQITCRKTCNFCGQPMKGDPACSDRSPDCPRALKDGSCTNPDPQMRAMMKKICSVTCGLCDV